MEVIPALVESSTLHQHDCRSPWRQRYRYRSVLGDDHLVFLSPLWHLLHNCAILRRDCVSSCDAEGTSIHA